MPTSLKETHLIRSFGRVKSRKLGILQLDLLENSLPKYEITLDQVNSGDFQQFLTAKKLFLEIGFGFGDFTFELAKRNHDTNVIAGETHLNGIINLLKKLEDEPQSNIKIFKSDIRTLLLTLPPEIFDEIYILFPDPWPKAKHYKRRLIQDDFIEVLGKKIKPSGKLVITTDHDSYKCWILSIMAKRNDFIWTANSQLDWQNFPENWTVTKYQKKALKEGRIPVYLEFLKFDVSS